MASTSRRPGCRMAASVVAVLATVPLAVAACSVAAESPASSGPDATSGQADVQASQEGGGSMVDTSSIRSIIDTADEAPTLMLGASLDPIAGDQSRQVSYVSGGLTVTGALRIPPGDGPFPGVVVVHGAVDPGSYESGSDLVSEQVALVEAGYVVLAADLRGYGDSDAANTSECLTVDYGFGWEICLDWGMALDVVNALELMRSGQIEQVDPSAVGLYGHSLGGLLAMDAAVIAPSATDVVVSASAGWADVSTLAAAALSATVGGSAVDPRADPEYWADMSSDTFVDRATAPVTLIHGTADDFSPPQASEDVAAAWSDAGGEAEVVILDGADHELEPLQDEANDVILEALDAALK